MPFGVEVAASGVSAAGRALNRIERELGRTALRKAWRNGAAEVRKEVRKRVPVRAVVPVRRRDQRFKHIRQTTKSGTRTVNGRVGGFVFVGSPPGPQQKEFFYARIIHQKLTPFMADGMEAGWPKLLARLVVEVEKALRAEQAKLSDGRRSGRLAAAEPSSMRLSWLRGEFDVYGVGANGRPGSPLRRRK